MKQPNWISLAVIAVVVIGFIAYVFWSKNSGGESSSIFSLEPTPTMSAGTKTPLYTPPPEATPVTGADPAAAATPTPVPSPVPDANLNPMRKTLVQSMPKVSTIREDARKNPHETPKAGVEFAMMLGDREKTAIANEQDSTSFMTELEACGLTKDPQLKSPTVQAICLTTAREISQKWPSLQARYELLMKNADPQAAGIARTAP